ncbi:hypothetical protein MRX96_018550 [Rhipicephalus microplus]
MYNAADRRNLGGKLPRDPGRSIMLVVAVGAVIDRGMGDRRLISAHRESPRAPACAAFAWLTPRECSTPQCEDLRVVRIERVIRKAEPAWPMHVAPPGRAGLDAEGDNEPASIGGWKVARARRDRGQRVAEGFGAVPGCLQGQRGMGNARELVRRQGG